MPLGSGLELLNMFCRIETYTGPLREVIYIMSSSENYGQSLLGNVLKRSIFPTLIIVIIVNINV